MKHLLIALSLTLTVCASASPPAAASSGDEERGVTTRSLSNVARASTRANRAVRVSDDYYTARPRRHATHRQGGYRQHYTKSRHARAAKNLHQRTAHRRSAGRRTAAHHKHHAAQRHAAAAPRNRGTASRGSGSVGMASYYWQPQRVASGGSFNPNGMTAAHKSLPFGSRVRVTHMGNGRSVEVRINDRGPYVAGRIIDLSKAAAGLLGMTAQGIARVRVEVLGR
jgi:rare lipoprotein A